MNNANALLDQLHDIEGLDAVNRWPLAIGYWIVIGLGIIFLTLLIGFAIKWFAYRKSWKHDSRKRLNHLLNTLSKPSVTEETIQNTTILFSEYLRRIALHRFSRSSCAGLKGKAWLEWLSQHDSKNFDWVNKGKLLATVPYANVKTSKSISVEELKALIHAAKDWVR